MQKLFATLFTPQCELSVYDITVGHEGDVTFLESNASVVVIIIISLSISDDEV